MQGQVRLKFDSGSIQSLKNVLDETSVHRTLFLGIIITNSRQENIIKLFKVFFISLWFRNFYNFCSVEQGAHKQFVPMIVLMSVILNVKKTIWNWSTTLMLLDNDLSVNISMLDLLLIKSKNKNMQSFLFFGKSFEIFLGNFFSKYQFIKTSGIGACTMSVHGQTVHDDTYRSTATVPYTVSWNVNRL